MPILRVNAMAGVPHLADVDGGRLAGCDTLMQGMGRAPVLIMLHGFGYSPNKEQRSPHDHILKGGEDHPLHRAQGWPRRMGYGEGTPDQGVCIAFGWEAGGSIWRAHREATRAGAALAALIRDLSDLGAGPVNIMAHSLGARVALAALRHLGPGDVGRMILLTGAELRSTAEAALQSPAGREAEVLNIISRENDVFDFIYEWLLAPHRIGARALGAGLVSPRSVTVQIDHPAHLAGLAALGFPTAPTARRMCHWSAYLRPGLFSLYRAYLGPSADLTLADLRTALIGPPTRRWSRLLSPPGMQAPFAVQ